MVSTNWAYQKELKESQCDRLARLPIFGQNMYFYVFSSTGKSTNGCVRPPPPTKELFVLIILDSGSLKRTRLSQKSE